MSVYFKNLLDAPKPALPIPQLPVPTDPNDSEKQLGHLIERVDQIVKSPSASPAKRTFSAYEEEVSAPPLILTGLTGLGDLEEKEASDFRVKKKPRMESLSKAEKSPSADSSQEVFLKSLTYSSSPSVPITPERFSQQGRMPRPDFSSYNQQAMAAAPSSFTRFNEGASPSYERPKPVIFDRDARYSSTPSKAPPPTPTKIKSEINSPFLKQHQQLMCGTFKYQTTYLAKGTFVNVYTLQNELKQIVLEVSNGELVLKAFHGEVSGFAPSTLAAYLKSIVKNFQNIKSLGLPVAEIYNANSAETDRYIIQRKVPDAINGLDSQQLVQVREYFIHSISSRIAINSSQPEMSQRIPMDLQPQNFRAQNGQLFLIDFLEQYELQEFDEADTFNGIALRAWARLFYDQHHLSKEETLAQLNYLTNDHYKNKIEDVFNTRIQ
jgi:hypothetical protein